MPDLSTTEILIGGGVVGGAFATINALVEIVKYQIVKRNGSSHPVEDIRARLKMQDAEARHRQELLKDIVNTQKEIARHMERVSWSLERVEAKVVRGGQWQRGRVHPISEPCDEDRED